MVFPRWNRHACLLALADEHRRLGRPVRRYKSVPPGEMVRLCADSIRTNAPLFYDSEFRQHQDNPVDTFRIVHGCWMIYSPCCFSSSWDLTRPK